MSSGPSDDPQLALPPSLEVPQPLCSATCCMICAMSMAPPPSVGIAPGSGRRSVIGGSSIWCAAIAALVMQEPMQWPCQDRFCPAAAASRAGRAPRLLQWRRRPRRPMLRSAQSDDLRREKAPGASGRAGRENGAAPHPGGGGAGRAGRRRRAQAGTRPSSARRSGMSIGVMFCSSRKTRSFRVSRSISTTAKWGSIDRLMICRA